MQITIKETTIQKLASDGKVNEGTERVDLKQVSITFPKIPQDLAEFRSIDRKGDNGRFVTMALLICAYKNWTLDNEDLCAEMMKELMNSPTAGNSYSNFTRSFVKERMMQNNKWKFIADAYFDGAAPNNGYTPSVPLTITLREYPYLPQTSTYYGKELKVDRIVSDFKGADSERSIQVYEDPTDGKWYIWSDSFGSLLADIKTSL
ncbi:MAG: hypothetical protein IK151_05875 [Erysipelotrichaceae bacterium]|nr:hypothetical protein [Erysipelotrichaceae bacterium]